MIDLKILVFQLLDTIWRRQEREGICFWTVFEKTEYNMEGKLERWTLKTKLNVGH